MKSNEATTSKSKADENSDELDTLVSDLLKQAITESDIRRPPQAGEKNGENAPSSKKSPHEKKFNHTGITLSKTVIEREFSQKIKEAPGSADILGKTEALKPALPSVTIQKRKMSFMILGFIVILVIAGILSYLIYSNNGRLVPGTAPKDELKNFSQTNGSSIETTGGAIATPVSEQGRVNNAIMNDSSVPDTDPAAASPSSSKPEVERSIPSPPAQKKTAVKKEESPNKERSFSNQSTEKKSKPAKSPRSAKTPAKIASNQASGITFAPVTGKPEIPKAPTAKQTAASAPPSGPKTDNSESAAVSGTKSSTETVIQKQKTARDAILISEDQDKGTVDPSKTDAASETGENASSEIQDPLAVITNTKEMQPSTNRPGQNIVGKKDEATPVDPLRENIEDPRPKPVPGAQTAPGELELTPAKLVSRVNPSYPRIGLYARISGIVELKVSINEQGKVTKAVPVSGPEIFYEEAIKAVMKWKYEPATRNGVVTASEAHIKIRFNAE